MRDRSPFVYLPPDADQRADEAKPTERRVTRRPKATFRWPPDCLLPFLDEGWDPEN